jgi:hypothetical protein
MWHAARLAKYTARWSGAVIGASSNASEYLAFYLLLREKERENVN